VKGVREESCVLWRTTGKMGYKSGEEKVRQRQGDVQPF
jgi:hypothetical protein